MIRLCGRGDFEFIRRVARHAYPGYDEGAASEFFHAFIENPSVVWLRGERGFIVAAHWTSFHGKSSYMDVQFLASLPGAGWEPYRLLKTVLHLARSNGAILRCGSDTTIDLSPLCKRLGGQPDMGWRWGPKHEARPA